MRAEAAGMNASDSLRGLVVRPDEAQQLLEKSALSSIWSSEREQALSLIFPEQDDDDLPLPSLLRTFNLSAIDAYVLLLALAPELDTRYERLYGYLQDDVTLRHLSVNLVMHLLGGDVQQRFAVWERLQAAMPLRKYDLITIDEPANRPNSAFIAHIIKVDARVAAFLLGQTLPDTRLRGSVQAIENPGALHLPEAVLMPIYRALPQAPLVFMQGNAPLEQEETAAAFCHGYRLPLLRVRVERLQALDIPLTKAWMLALREGALLGAALLIDDWDALLGESRTLPEPLWEPLQQFPYPMFLCAREEWEPVDARRQRLLLRLRFETPSFAARVQAWKSAVQSEDVPSRTLEQLAGKYRFHRAQIIHAAQTGRDMAASRGESLQPRDLQGGAEAHASLKLGRFARRVRTKASWEQLVLPEEPLRQLREIADRARFAHIVQEEWGFRQHLMNTAGISALFAGESGTGKTLSAQVIATELGLPLYKVDISGVVSKYIGETEKNLRVIFDEAQSSSAILFFDEADALFGKRSEVKDARDRYANIEVAYLLQQIEDYDGIAILATNLRQNLDEAFTRRLDFLVDFPFPDAEYRYRIWQVHFPPQAPLDAEVDLQALAERYPLSGGNIRNIALAAAYLAASDGGRISHAQIYGAIRREHQKMGRLVEASDVDHPRW